MEYKLQYKDSKERNVLIEQNKNKHVIGEMNIKEGNFLIFSDEPLAIEKSKDAIIAELSSENTALKAELESIKSEIVLISK